MNLLVIGGGGREHAIIKKLRENKQVKKIYALPGNGGIGEDAQCVPIKATDIEGVLEFAKSHKVDFAAVIPDDPLALGMADKLREMGIPTFGPTAQAAEIESSKVFAKNLMQKYHIPTADYQVFDQAEKAMEYITQKNKYPVVIKADGLALGKGVIIAADPQAAKEAVEAIMNEKIFGKSGDHVIVEEFLQGPEVSVLSFTDGETLRPMVTSMDHKRAYDGDEGPNTGGMGAVAPNPYYTKEVAQRCMEEIFLPTIRAMKQEGRPFQGCLYFGLMLTPDGPKVIEYNCRFGDPETQVVLPLLKTDLLTIFQAVMEGRLSQQKVEFLDKAACCVILASGGYPKNYYTGLPISGIEEAEQMEDVSVYHAGTKMEDGKLLTAGGRVLGVTALANDLAGAMEKAYEAAGKIHFDNMHYRRDIGRRALSMRGE
ncbi:phosphoribosylamine--glycine ligase [Intestinimonas butyriciproducens]|uniref:phosphoribosylamine--glycine ligase n=1 Tax=Intestinimonas butyriciproducens TaxID=1297617 RepID=UPI00195BBD40|nr:phosphoribosylamine--glycine ligase [Intestinimonas butyriciproducens]MBM6919105.1 phosphoribosylamine--glycine ligase [Intestinimonas butyriciproducens]